MTSFDPKNLVNQCYAILVIMTFAGIFTDKIPIQLNIVLHSMTIIAIGSYKSLDEFKKQMKRVWVDKVECDDTVERMTFNDAIQFPIVAGCTLCGLYFAMQYFGKDSVNYFILGYIALGGTVGIKALLHTVVGENRFKSIDTDLLINLQWKKIDLDLQVTLLDIYCFMVSALMMVGYAYFRSFVFNNLICFFFCIHALQSAFIGNFKNGFMLLTLLFFYDIFFVFGTDVMLTVAKNIDAPIKLQFPRDYSGEKPQFSILGLGDIVIPGIFVSLCLRYDFLKTIDPKKFEKLVEADDAGPFIKYLNNTAHNAPKTYFLAVNIGYLIAIICTVVVMLVFNHGQPALLYLVPGCIFSVCGLAVYQGDFAKLWDFSEDDYITRPGGDEDDDDKKDK